jgi:hypothetical protein
MKRNDRTSSIVSFQSDPQTVVMLVSIKAGGVGYSHSNALLISDLISLQHRMYLCSNLLGIQRLNNKPLTESIVLDKRTMSKSFAILLRVYFSLISLISDSIEENMVQLQQKKKELADLVNKKQTKESLTSDRLKDLRMLFA